MFSQIQVMIGVLARLIIFFIGVILVVIVGLTLFICISKWMAHPPYTDAELLAHFHDNRGTLEALIAVLDQHSEAVHVDGELPLDQTETGMHEEEADFIHQTMIKTKIESASPCRKLCWQNRENAEVQDLLHLCWFLSMEHPSGAPFSRGTKGYIYCPFQLRSHAKKDVTTDELWRNWWNGDRSIHQDADDFLVWRQVENRWYLFHDHHPVP